MSEPYLPVWRENFKVRSFDIGLNAVMRMSSICSYFQEIAGQHANHLDLGYHFMQREGKVWMLSRLYMNIIQMPSWGQEFYAETWPMGIERIFYRRDYHIGNGQNIMIKACSYWLLLDIKTRRPTVVPIDEKVIKANAGRPAMDMPSESFPSVLSDDIEIHKVKYSDLDQNNHVNNARYVEWTLDHLGPAILEKRNPSFFFIEYKHEVRAGDTVQLYHHRFEADKPIFFVEGSLNGSNQVCFRSKIVF